MLVREVPGVRLAEVYALSANSARTISCACEPRVRSQQLAVGKQASNVQGKAMSSAQAAAAFESAASAAFKPAVAAAASSSSKTTSRNRRIARSRNIGSGSNMRGALQRHRNTTRVTAALQHWHPTQEQHHLSVATHLQDALSFRAVALSTAAQSHL